MQLCIFCREPTCWLFSAKDYATDDTTERRLNWCPRCDFGRIEGEFTPGQIAHFYPPGYYTHSSAPELTSQKTFFQKAILNLAWRLDDGRPFDPSELPGGSSVCDIGCGSGAALRQFKSAGYRTTGIDPDQQARAAATDAGEILPGTAEDLPNLGTFDVVLMSHVLEHCIDPSKAIANAKSILGPNGTLVIEVPNNAAIGFRWFRAAWPWSDIPRHLNFFTRGSLDDLLSQHGLTVTKTVYVGFTRQFGTWWRERQQNIWQKTGTGKVPNFTIAAWWLLFRSVFADDDRKYDSIRVHAISR